jgi:hypothetical protein
MRMPFWLLFAGVVLALGCGGPGSGKYAPVSGQVTLNGSPLADATVSFQPDATIGRGSSGKTDAQGKYSLMVLGTGEKGALVGKHKVVITAPEGPPPDPQDDNPKPRPDRVPPQYNANSTLTFDVLAGGTDQANFPLAGSPPEPEQGGSKRPPVRNRD